MSKRFLAVVAAMLFFLPFFASASAASGSFTVTAFRGCADNSVNIQFSGDAIPTYGELSLHNTSDDWTYGFSPFSPVAGVYSPVARNWDVAAVRIPGLEGIISLFVPGCAPGGVTGPAVSETVQVGDPEPVELHACITYRDDETQEVHPFTFSSYEEAETAGFIFAEDGSVTLTPGMARGARLVDCEGQPTEPVEVQYCLVNESGETQMKSTIEALRAEEKIRVSANGNSYVFVDGKSYFGLCDGRSTETPGVTPTPEPTVEPTQPGTEVPTEEPGTTPAPTVVPTKEPAKEPVAPAPGGTNTPTTQAVDGMPNTGSGPARNSDMIALAALGAAGVALMLLGGGIVVRRKF